MTKRDRLQTLINTFSLSNLNLFFREANSHFREIQRDYAALITDDPAITDLRKIGQIDQEDGFNLVIAAGHSASELTSRSGRQRQYKYAKRILDTENSSAGIFVFYDDEGHFRFSLVVKKYFGLRHAFTSYRRFTYFIDPILPNKTFLNQVGNATFDSLENMLRAFSIEAVSDDFYKEFDPNFHRLAEAVQGTDAISLKEDFALLFVIRIIFLGFVQKKKWLGDNERFIQDFEQEYLARQHDQDMFYRDWLKPLFFEALNNPPGHVVAYGQGTFTEPTQAALNNAPYLNGELFKSKRGVDDQGLWIPDEPIHQFLEFLFQFNFTVEENRQYDEELELNPEFLGIIFERIVNKADGAVYTPRTEVDLMCRLGLVKWLQDNNSSITQEQLYRFFFHQRVNGEEENEPDVPVTFTPEQVTELLKLLLEVTVCDPAAGSGAFEVGMLHVLTEALETLYDNDATPTSLKAKKPSDFELKKAIIANSLYGVEVKRWAVWINQLRLWLTLFVDMPDEMKFSLKPLLPNLTFKVRVGDSLVQRIGTRRFPVQGRGTLPASIRNQLNRLMQTKREYFNNHAITYEHIESEELRVFSEILDQEIDTKRARIAQLRAPQYQQDALIQSEKQLSLDLPAANQQKIEQLEAEIRTLQEQKTCLGDQRPFLWSLEFSEVFFDKGGFDIIIGNPPYVRHEAIADPNAILNVQDYKDELKQMLLLDFPQYFQRSIRAQDEFRDDHRPDGHSDLYTYFYVRSLRLLNPKGVHVFICSNSWLDVGFGAWVQEFMLHKTPILMVIDNHARRSFASSDINTIITILGAPRAETAQNFKTKFIAFKKPFEETISADAFLTIENALEIYKNDDLRVYPITVAELFREGSQASGGDGTGPMHYMGNKWGGIYLRAPDIYFTILEKGRGKLVKLGDVSQVRFGIKTGANDFFYLRPLGPGSRPGLMRVRNGAGWEGEIEEEFLKPVIKSLRDCRTINVSREDLPFALFICSKTRRELTGSKAIEYISWGENENVTIKQGSKKGEFVKGYQNISSIKCRKIWWDLGRQEGRMIVVPSKIGERYLVINNSDLFLEDKTLYSITPNNKDFYIELCAALNSQLTRFFIELSCRQMTGSQAIADVDVNVWEKVPIIDINSLDPNILKELREALKIISKQYIHGIFEEFGFNICENRKCSNKDHPYELIQIDKLDYKELTSSNHLVRFELDEVIFKILGLNQEEKFAIYYTILDLVKKRLIKAKSLDTE